MKTSKYFSILASAALFFIWLSSVSAQEKNKENQVQPVTVGSILKDAKVPLSDEQAEQLKVFTPSSTQAFLKLYQIFDDEQKKALKIALGIMPAKNNLPETPRSLILVVILDNLNNPLTKKQVDQLKLLSTEPNQKSAQEMNSILTKEQKDAMQKAFEK